MNMSFLLPNTKDLKHHPMMKIKNFATKYEPLIAEYEKDNKFVDMAKEYATSLIDKFNEMKDVAHRSRLFELIWGWYFSYQHFIELFSSCCILTSVEEIELSNYLYRLYKKMSKLSECS